MKIVLIIAIAALLIAGVSFLAVYLNKKKINALPIFEAVEKGLGFADTLAIALTPFIKCIPAKVISIVAETARDAVTRAEAVYKVALETNTVTVDNRKVTAVSFINSALALDGITPDSDTDKLINAVIEVLVLALPKTHTVQAQ